MPGAAGAPLAQLLSVPEAFDRLMRSQNPDLAYAGHHAQGYALATVTADAFAVVFSKVKPLAPDDSAPADPLEKRTRTTLRAGSLAPVVEDNVAQLLAPRHWHGQVPHLPAIARSSHVDRHT